MHESEKNTRPVMKVPNDLEIEITSKCNLRCAYCSHFGSAGDVNKDLPTEEWLQFFQELGECTVTKVTLSGGEPFIRTDLKELLAGIVENRMRFSFLTNGTLITEDIAAYIKETNRCNSIQVSIDGPSPEAHDIFRGEGSFVKAINGLKILQKYGIGTVVRYTIHKNNIDQLEEAARFLIEEVGLRGFSTNAASHLGLCQNNQEMVQLTTDDYTRAMDILEKLNQKYQGAIEGLAGPVALADQWRKMEHAKKQNLASLPKGGYLTSCNGVFKGISVRSDGVLIPCSQLSHIELGRINHDSLREVWQNHPELNRLRQRQGIPLSKFKYCQGCEYINYCKGGCPAVAYTLTSKDSHPSPDVCYKRFLETGGKLPPMEKE